MENLMDWVSRKKKYIFIFALCTCLIHFIICVQKNIGMGKSLSSLGISLVLFFVGWGASFLVLGFQHLNPFCSKKVFRFFCYFFFIGGLIGTFCNVIYDIFVSLMLPKEKLNEFSSVPLILGDVYSCIFLFNKYGREPASTNEIAEKNLDGEGTGKKKSYIKWIALFGGIIVFVVGLFFGIETAFEKSEPYKHSLELIENNADAKKYLGEDYSRTGVISGSMSTKSGGVGSADISFKIKGVNGVSTVYVDAYKEYDVWKYKLVRLYKLKGVDDFIDLLEPANVGNE